MSAEAEDEQDNRENLALDVRRDRDWHAEEGLCYQCGGKKGECPHTKIETLAPAKVDVHGFRVNRETFLERMQRQSAETRAVAQTTAADARTAENRIASALDALRLGQLGTARSYLILGKDAIHKAICQLPE